MPQYVDLGAVAAGCAQIDSAIAMFSTAKASIDNASSMLDHNSLRFGSINSSLEEQLDELRTQTGKCSDMNSGVTSTIMANAQAQYEEYMAWLRAQEEAAKKKTE